VQINNPKGLANRLKKFEPTKEKYKRVKNIMKWHWDRKKVIADSMIWQQYTTFNHNTLVLSPFFRFAVKCVSAKS